MTTLPAEALVVQARSLLDACVESLASVDEHPEAYLYPGQPVIDLGEPPRDGILIVHVGQVVPAPVGFGQGPLAAYQDQRVARIPHVVLATTYARCADLWGASPGESPEPSMLTDEATIHARAGWALMNGIHDAATHHGLFDACGDYALGPLLPLLPSGNAVGWTFEVTISLPGYTPLG